MNDLTISGDLEALDEVYQYIISVAQKANLNKKTAYKLRLAIDEIATNIILHGYEAIGKKGDIYLSSKLDEKTLTISIEDTGIPYNPTLQAIPDDLALSLENRKIGGLGVYLAIEGVDRFIYERIGDRNRNILVVNR